VIHSFNPAAGEEIRFLLAGGIHESDNPDET
jgi:hypothetical protein